MEAIILIITAVIAALFFALALCNNRPECFGTDPHEGEQLSRQCRQCDDLEECLGNDV